MKTTAERLAALLDGELSHAWLIAGDEPLLVAEAAGELRDAARSRGFGERELHLVERGFDWNILAASAQNLSLFASRRVVEVRLASPRPGDRGAEVLAALAADPDPDRLLLVQAPKLDAAALRSAWVRAFEQHGVLVQVWPVDVAALPGWIAARMRRAGLEPDRDTVQLLASRCEGNLLAARQEIDTLVLGEGQGRITLARALASVGDSARYDVFKLADAALAGDARRALRVLEGLRREGVEPVLISWSLSRELRALARLFAQRDTAASVERLLEVARVWPRRRALIRKALLRLTADRLAELQQLAARIDLASKGQGGGLPWSLITEFVLGLSRADVHLPQARLPQALVDG